MPRPPRADEARGIDHALNRGNARQTIFHGDADLEAFERIVAEALRHYPVELSAYQWMPNHWHMVRNALAAGLVQAQKTGAGEASGIGAAGSPRYNSPLGRSRVCEDGWNVPIKRSVNKKWKSSDDTFVAEVPWETTGGWNRQPDDSIWKQLSGPEVDRKGFPRLPIWLLTFFLPTLPFDSDSILD